MLQTIQNIFWEVISIKTSIPTIDCKTIIPNLHYRLQKSEVDIMELSPAVRQAVNFYIENREELQLD